MEPPERSFPIDLDPFALLEAGVLRRMHQGLEPRSALDARLLVAESGSGLTLLLPAHADRIVEILRNPRSIGEVEGADIDPERTRAAATVLLALGAIRFA